MNYLSLNNYLQDKFGTKVYKLSIDGGFTCPNRDGRIHDKGCIFCSGYGSGDFATSRELSITDQIEKAKEKVSKKIKDGKYIAYFQAFTNTYAPVHILRSKFLEAINNEDIVAISIATRPDCLSKDVLDLLSELNHIKPVWVELGLQTIHEKSAEFIRRGYSLDVYDEAMRELKARDLYTVTHVILGLPGESEKMMLETVNHACVSKSDGIKLQLLHIIRGTDLGTLYIKNHRDEIDIECIESDETCECSDEYKEIMSTYQCMTLEEYCNLIKKCIEIIPNDIAIHRMTGDGDKRTLIAPLWSGDKKRVLNTLNKIISCQ